MATSFGSSFPLFVAIYELLTKTHKGFKITDRNWFIRLERTNCPLCAAERLVIRTYSESSRTIVTYSQVDRPFHYN